MSNSSNNLFGISLILLGLYIFFNSPIGIMGIAGLIIAGLGFFIKDMKK